MERRRFLGSLVGLVAGAPFYALPRSADWQRPAYEDLFVMIRDKHTGITIQAPGITTITKSTKEVTNGTIKAIRTCFDVQVEPIKFLRTFMVDEIIVLDSKKQVVSVRPPAQRIPCVAGDTLNITNELWMEYFDEVTLPEFIASRQALKGKYHAPADVVNVMDQIRGINAKS